ncbi:MAG: transcriptional regulator [Desulfobacterales bacterium]|nr:transcriptional regulator [Desulfobacterales bacterium]MDX2511101.1 transcriptional regulator [Desulfobacterales bacterium]
MARGDQLGRQWKIIRSLIASNRGKSVQNLASELSCHSRTVYRDLEALQVAGFPIYTERKNQKNYWSLMESAKHQIPIPFNITELMALYFSSDMLKMLKNTLFYDSLESLFQKIKATLPPEYMTYLQHVESSLKVDLKPTKDYSQFGEIIDQINEAILNRRHVRITYFVMSRKKTSQRVVDPYKLWFFDGTFYMLGFCHLRKDIRLFAVDRIRKMVLTDTTFETPQDFDIENFLRDSFGTFLGEPVQVVIHFSPRIAGYIVEKSWHESQVVEKQKDGSLIFKAEIAGTEEIKFWILRWGKDAVVLKPDSLREEIRIEAESVLKNYREEQKSNDR